MSKIGDLGMKAAEGAVGQVLGMVMGGAQDRRQLKQQEKLQELQIKGNKEMGEFNNQLQLDMWNKTNYGAQMEHLKGAGLNPGLIYGMGGAGGATTGGGGGGGVSGGQAANAAATQQNNMAMGMQLAQMRLIEAQTEKTKVEAAKLEGVDTEQAKAQTGLLNTTNQLKIIEKDVAQNTKDDAIKEIVGRAEQSIYDARTKEAGSKVAMATTGEQIEQIKETLKGTAQAVANARAQGNILEAETAIKGFEAKMAERGIPVNSPWIVKFITDLLDSMGISIIPK